jgi:hypothetical protein|tara:strand:+ start:87 stop:668 length:582 start_codon:yes stop_codon:yes gene_type:complete
MKGFAVPLLGFIFVALITSYIPFSAGDASADTMVVSEDKDKLNNIPTHDSKYKIYLHVLIRNAQGELIGIADTGEKSRLVSGPQYLPHEITDEIFDMLNVKKEIITVDNIKYEKIQISDSYEQTMTTTTYFNQNLFEMNDREPSATWMLTVCGELVQKLGYDCVNIFQCYTSLVYLEVGDIITSHWTILRETN